MKYSIMITSLICVMITVITYMITLCISNNDILNRFNQALNNCNGSSECIESTGKAYRLYIGIDQEALKYKVMQAE